VTAKLSKANQELKNSRQVVQELSEVRTVVVVVVVVVVVIVVVVVVVVVGGGGRGVPRLMFTLFDMTITGERTAAFQGEGTREAGMLLLLLILPLPPPPPPPFVSLLPHFFIMFGTGVGR